MMKINKTQVVFGILVLAGMIGIAVTIFCNLTGIEISLDNKECLFPTVLHLYCPGCGGTRAVRYLMKGDVIRSFLAHPIVLYALLLYIQSLIVSIYTVFIKKDNVLRTYVYIWQIWLALGIVLSVFIVRNACMVFGRIDFLGDCLPFWQERFPILS